MAEEKQKKKPEKKPKKDDRTRAYWAIGYPESLPEDWVDKLESKHIECYISPLHDKDVDPDGNIKKPHYHVIFHYTNKKSLEQAKQDFEDCGCVRVEPCSELVGCARYECHLDNPEKYQYPVDEVISLSGGDYLALIEKAADRANALRNILKFIKYNDVVSFSEFAEWCAENDPVWFRVVTSTHTVFLTKYIQSRLWAIEKGFVEKSQNWKIPEKAKDPNAEAKMKAIKSAKKEETESNDG